MKTYHFDNINNCVLYGSLNGRIENFIGSIIHKMPNKKGYKKEEHPKELERQERLKQALEAQAQANNGDRMSEFRRFMKKKMSPYRGGDLSNTIIIVNGNSGFGTKNVRYYIDKFEPLNTLLANNNAHLLFVRGGFDDPQIFNEEVINLSNVKTIPDYSVLQLKNFNCLCIGGHTSIDKKWRSEQENRIGRKMSWDNEGLQYKDDEVKEILDKYNIACVVTNTCPSFAYPGTNVFNQSSWVKSDKKLLSDILEERKAMDKLYDELLSRDKKPYVWAYSMFMSQNSSFCNDICFRSLGTNELYDFNNNVKSNFGNVLDGKAPQNKTTIDKLINEQGTRNWGEVLATNDWGEAFDGAQVVQEDEVLEEEEIEDELDQEIPFDPEIRMGDENMAQVDEPEPRLYYMDYLGVYDVQPNQVVGNLDRIEINHAGFGEMNVVNE